MPAGLTAWQGSHPGLDDNLQPDIYVKWIKNHAISARNQTGQSWGKWGKYLLVSYSRHGYEP